MGDVVTARRVGGTGDKGEPAPRAFAGHWPWAIAAVLIVLFLGGTFLAFRIIAGMTEATQSTLDMPVRVAERVAGAFKPSVQVHTVIHGAIGELKKNPKLVVLTAKIPVEVTKSSSTHWGYVYWGTTTVTIRAQDNQIQYVIPLHDVNTSDFVYDEAHKRLTVHVPAPRIDEDMVSVQSDPSKIDVKTDLGWAKFDKWSGEPLRDEAKRDLRTAVLSQGRNEAMEALAEKNAREHLKQLLAPVAGALQNDVTLEIAFKPNR